MFSGNDFGVRNFGISYCIFPMEILACARGLTGFIAFKQAPISFYLRSSIKHLVWFPPSPLVRENIEGRIPSIHPELGNLLYQPLTPDPSFLENSICHIIIFENFVENSQLASFRIKIL